MNATNKHENSTLDTLAGAVAGELKRVGWQIEDAKQRLAKAAQSMLRRAQEATDDCRRMVAGEPCSLSWVEFAEGDLRQARDAKASLSELNNQKAILEFFARKASEPLMCKCMNCGCETDADICEKCAAG